MNEQEYHRAVQAVLAQADKSLSHLPHPARLRAISDLTKTSLADERRRATVVWAGQCDSLKLGQFAVELLSDPTVTTADFIKAMAMHSPVFRSMLMQSTHTVANTNFGNIEGMVMDSRQRLLEWPMFQTRDTLEQRLQFTDIGADTPCKYFRLPFDRIYVECGETRSSPLRIHNVQSGEHIFEGAYLEQIMQIKDGLESRAMYIMLMGSPVGKAHLADDSFYTLSVELGDDNASLESVLERTFASSADDNRSNRTYLPTGHFREFGDKDRNAILAAVFHIAKVLLYLNSQGARTEMRRERSDLVKQIAGRTGGGKVSKAQRKLPRTYDRILVGTPNLPTIDAPRGSAAAQGSHKNAHWRRGHFRNQAYGPNWSLSKNIYIEPVLVHGDLESTVPKAKPYKLG